MARKAQAAPTETTYPDAVKAASQTTAMPDHLLSAISDTNIGHSIRPSVRIPAEKDGESITLIGSPIVIGGKVGCPSFAGEEGHCAAKLPCLRIPAPYVGEHPRIGNASHGIPVVGRSPISRTTSSGMVSDHHHSRSSASHICIDNSKTETPLTRTPVTNILHMFVQCISGWGYVCDDSTGCDPDFKGVLPSIYVSQEVF